MTLVGGLARILVVEDNEANSALVEYLLRAHGYEPLIAANGGDGIRFAERLRPHVILLDLRMPGIDGYEVAAAVRRAPRLGLTKIVALTASAMLGDRERIAAAGFDGYIQKPIDAETFVERVESFLPARARRSRPTTNGR